MAEYIDRKQLLELINEDCKYKKPTNEYTRGCNDVCEWAIKTIENMPTADVVPKSEVEDTKIKVVAGVIAEIAERLKSKHNTFKTCASRLIGNEYASGRMEAYEEFIDILNEISKKNTDTSPADPKEAFIKKLVDNWKWGEEE